MSGARRLRLYANQFDRAVLALTIELGEDGKVAFVQGDDATAAALLMELIGRAAFSPTAPPTYSITPEAGAAYLDAVAENIGKLSRWLVAEEPLAAP